MILKYSIHYISRMYGAPCVYGINSSCFQLLISQNLATSTPSLTSQSCGDFLLAVYLARQVGAIYRPPEHPWMPGKPVNETSVKVDC